MQVHVDAKGKYAVLRLQEYLKREDFSRYVETVRKAGGWYDSASKAQVARLESLPQVLLSLREAGFSPQLSQGLQQLVEEENARATRRQQAVEGRLQQVPAYSFQAEGVRWLSQMRAGILADDMGLGKTMQALLAAGDSMVVVCPAGLKSVWVTEAQRWRPDFRPEILYGRWSFRWPKPGELIITNYEVLPEQPPPACPEGITLVADEAHYVKTARAIRTRRFRLLSMAVRARGGSVWELTGTPLQGHEPELWVLLTNLGLHTQTFGNWRRYRDLMGGREGIWGTEWTGRIHPSVPEILSRVMLRRRKVDVLSELPPKQHQILPVYLDGQTSRLCDAVIQEAEAKTGFSWEELLVRILSGGPSGVVPFERLARVRYTLAKVKISALLDLVTSYEESEEPVVVFSCHLAPIQAFLSRPGWGVITGSRTPAERAQVVEEFQAGKLRGVACTIPVGGYGLTLTRARHEVFVDLSWTPAENLQAEDRAWRIGQKHPLLIRWLVADHPLERRLAEVLQAKMRLIEATVEKVGGAGRKVRPDSELYM